MFIYLIVNHVTGKYYVGQHKGNNLKKYLQQKVSQAWYELKRGKRGSSHLFNSMRKHPKEAWSIHALLSDVQTRPELDQYERDFISFLKSQDPDYGYNICRGGEGFSGPHSEEAKQKNSVASLKMWDTPEIRTRMLAKLEITIDKQRGVPRSDEVCAAISKGMADPEVFKKRSDYGVQLYANGGGHLHSPELKAKRAEASRTPEARARVSAQMKAEFAAGTRTVPGHDPEVAARISAALSGVPLSEAHCASISKSLVEQYQDGRRTPPSCNPEVAAKIAASHMGKKHSPESKARMRAAKLGKTWSPETREKRRLAHLAKKNINPSSRHGQ